MDKEIILKKSNTIRLEGTSKRKVDKFWLKCTFYFYIEKFFIYIYYKINTNFIPQL